MIVADVKWTRDHHGGPVLELKLDGHPVYIRSSRRTDLIDRGIVDGVVFLNSERARQLPNVYMRGDYAPAYHGLDLVGCTDDPTVFALFQSMCEAIRTDTWHEGARTVMA